MAQYQTPWMCINEGCGHTIGFVIGGELTPAEDLMPGDISTRGSNIILRCPVCGTPKTWYSSDPLARALNQLVDVLSEAIAKRAIHVVNIRTK